MSLTRGSARTPAPALAAQASRQAGEAKQISAVVARGTGPGPTERRRARQHVAGASRRPRSALRSRSRTARRRACLLEPLQLEGLAGEAVQCCRGAVDLGQCAPRGTARWMVAGSSLDRSQHDSPEFRQIVARRNPCGEGGELGVHSRVAVDPSSDRIVNPAGTAEVDWRRQPPPSPDSVGRVGGDAPWQPFRQSPPSQLPRPTRVDTFSICALNRRDTARSATVDRGGANSRAWCGSRLPLSDRNHRPFSRSAARRARTPQATHTTLSQRRWRRQASQLNRPLGLGTAVGPRRISHHIWASDGWSRLRVTYADCDP